MLEFEIEYGEYSQHVDEDMLALIQRMGEMILEEEGFEGDFEVSLSFLSDEEIQELNRNYRGKNSPTDVLSFPMLDEDCDEFEFDDIIPVLLGDIMVSMPTAIRQAQEYNHSLKREILFLVCHSMLHLIGYDHLEEGDRILMEEKQEYYLQRLGVSRDE